MAERHEWKKTIHIHGWEFDPIITSVASYWWDAEGNEKDVADLVPKVNLPGEPGEYSLRSSDRMFLLVRDQENLAIVFGWSTEYEAEEVLRTHAWQAGQLWCCGGGVLTWLCRWHCQRGINNGEPYPLWEATLWGCTCEYGSFLRYLGEENREALRRHLQEVLGVPVYISDKHP